MICFGIIKCAFKLYIKTRSNIALLCVKNESMFLWIVHININACIPTIHWPVHFKCIKSERLVYISKTYYGAWLCLFGFIPCEMILLLGETCVVIYMQTIFHRQDWNIRRWPCFRCNTSNTLYYMRSLIRGYNRCVC